MEDMNNTIFKDLNTAQNEAVKQIDGPCLIIAGAGSGKTTVLTCRIANILAQGCLPSKVLSLTFTKKAAMEMKQRISTLVGADKARWIWMGTFHSIFSRFLRGNAQLLGYPDQFTIYDQSDSKSAIRQCIKELGLDDKMYKPSDVLSRISKAKNNLVTAESYRNNALLIQNDMNARKGRICDIYTLYAQKCKTAGAMDFDDILLNTNILFRDFPDALAQIREQFHYILVDEYQDTNYAQYLILKKLSALHNNICVVGDDSQSIYGFRGARVENILNFQKDYPNAKVVRLEQNYRSTQTIVKAANSLISKNEHRLKKECFSRSEEGEKVGVIKAFTEQEEAYLIASSIIEKIYADKAQYDNFVILYRTNAQSRALEEALRKKNLPYRIYAGYSFYDRAEVKDMLAYFRLIVNPKDDEAFRRVINVPTRGIGDTSMGYLANVAQSNNCSLYDALFLPDNVIYESGLKETALRKMRAFGAVITELFQKSAQMDAYQIALEVGNSSGLLISLKNDISVEGQAKYENIQELFNSVKDFVDEENEMRNEMEDSEGDDYTAKEYTITLSEYLENVALLSEVEKEDEQDKESTNRITLMTVHSSKGLEFPYVYIAGMEENLFPSESRNGNLEDIEEERRLFYVALTRAKKCATISFAKNRMKWGQHSSNPVSRFVREIDSQYLSESIEGDDLGSDILTSGMKGFGEIPSSGRGSSYGTSRFGSGSSYQSSSSRGSYGHNDHSSQVSANKPQPIFSKSAPRALDPNFRPDPIYKLAVGQRVEHDRFGFGTILSFDGEDANKKAIVNFETGGSKTLLLKYAKLRIVE